MQFGRRSEKLDPDQLNLALEDLEQAIAESEAEQEKADPALRQARAHKGRAGRGPLPEHLPRGRDRRRTGRYRLPTGEGAGELFARGSVFTTRPRGPGQ